MANTQDKQFSSVRLEWVRALSMAFIPITVAFVGSFYTLQTKNREVEGEFVNLAVSILKEEPTADTKNIRSWATEVVNEYSGVRLNPNAQEDLIKNVPLLEIEPQKLDTQNLTIPLNRATPGADIKLSFSSPPNHNLFFQPSEESPKDVLAAGVNAQVYLDRQLIHTGVVDELSLGKAETLQGKELRILFTPPAGRRVIKIGDGRFLNRMHYNVNLSGGLNYTTHLGVVLSPELKQVEANYFLDNVPELISPDAVERLLEEEKE